jgi:hypothetical protein
MVYLIFMVSRRNNRRKRQYTMRIRLKLVMRVQDHISLRLMPSTKPHTAMRVRRHSQCKGWFLANP